MSTEIDQIEPWVGGIDGLRRYVAGRPWRIIPEIDKDPVIIAYTETLRGRIIVFTCFALLLQWSGQNPLLAVLAEACAVAGRYRWRVIPLATLAVLYQKNFCMSDDLVATIASQEGVVGRLRG